MSTMTITLIVLAVTAAFFVWGKIRSDIVALSALLLLTLLNILTPAEALSGFSNSVVLMMAGLFVVGGAVFQTGLAKSISLRLLKLAGQSELKLFLLIMLVTVFFGSFVSNTGTVALLLPIVVSLATEANINARRLLMPMAFASSMGGMMTLIGTPPNMIINDVLVEAGFDGLSFFTFLPVGIIIAVIGISGLLPLSRLLAKKENRNKGATTVKSPIELAKEYQISDNLFRIKVPSDSSIKGKKLHELQITQRYNISVLEVRRRANQQSIFLKAAVRFNQELAGAETIIQGEDVLYLFGNYDQIKSFVDDNKLKFIDSSFSEGKHLPDISGKLKFEDIGIAEVVIMSTSKLINKVVKVSGFRAKYNVNILGIKRGKEYLLHNVKDDKIQSGDALLVQGTWSDIEHLMQEEPDVVVVGRPSDEASKVPLSSKAPIAGVIMVAMVALMVLNVLTPVIAVLTAAVAMIFTGCFRNVEAAYKTINWESIVLFATMIPMAIAMEKTGASQAISGGIVSGLGQYGPHVVLAGIYMGTSLLSMFISNTATTVLFAPIALQSAVSLGISSLPLLFAVAAAASACFATPFATPPNALVMSAGRYTFKDYVKIGMPLQLVIGIVMILVLPLLFPF